MIVARGLRYRYPNGVVGLDGVDLSVAHGERVAVLGPNGAGKTTLMLHLNGLLAGDGALDVAGIRDVRELRAAVGLVFQDPDDQLFMPTVGEDVAFGPLNLGLTRDEVTARVRVALAAVRMSHVEDRAPHQLSLGQRRRVAIATVLAMRPRLLVLDEPSANLDPRARRELLEVLDAVDRTMLVVTHDLPFAARLCERAVILSAGAWWPTVRARRSSPTRTCSPRMTSSFRRGTTSGRLPAPDPYTAAHGRRRDAPSVRLDGGGHDPQVAQVRRRRRVPRRRAGRDRDRQGQHDVRGRPGRDAEDRRPGGRHAARRRHDRADRRRQRRREIGWRRFRGGIRWRGFLRG